MVRGERRRGRALLIVVLVLIVLVIAADLISRVVAEHEVASQAKKQLASEDITMSGTPSVKISGWPFLTQVISGRYDKINIVVPQPSSKGVALSSLNVTATGVNAPASTVMSGNGQIEADKVVGTGQIEWSSFTQMVDLSGLKQYGVDPASIRISGSDDGKITVSAPVKLAGQSFTATATGAVTVTNNLLHVKITDIKSDSGSGGSIGSELLGIQTQLTFDTRLPALPYHLVLNSIQTTAAGVTINASATDVILGS